MSGHKANAVQDPKLLSLNRTFSSEILSGRFIPYKLGRLKLRELVRHKITCSSVQCLFHHKYHAQRKG
jgi:uncharacterized protein with von Willebrand factor type A (vWA) domain